MAEQQREICRFVSVAVARAAVEMLIAFGGPSSAYLRDRHLSPALHRRGFYTATVRLKRSANARSSAQLVYS